jgi:hypothetical protein
MECIYTYKENNRIKDISSLLEELNLLSVLDITI